MSYYRNLLAVASVAVFFTCVPQYVNSFNYDAKPAWWVLAFCLMSLPVLSGEKASREALLSPVALWCFGYAWLTIMWFFYSSQSGMAWEEVRLRFLSIITIMCCLMVFWDSGATLWARRAVVAATLFGVAANIYEFFVPAVSFSLASGRSAGLYMNPNQSAETLVLGMILSFAILPVLYRGLFVLVTGVGIVLTLSRYGILAWLAAVTVLSLAGKISVKNLVVSSLMGILLVGIILLSQGDQFSKAMGNIDTNKDVQERLLWFTDPSGVSDSSSWHRAYIAKQAWNKVADHPLVGSGTGSSREDIFPAHNQYLSFMEDHGVLIGGAMLPLLVLAVIWGVSQELRLVALVFGCTIIWQGLFAQSMLEQESRALLVSLMAAMAGSSRIKETEVSIAVKQRRVAERPWSEPQSF